MCAVVVHGRCNDDTVIGWFNRLVQANKKHRVASVTAIYPLTVGCGVGKALSCFFVVVSVIFLSAARRDKVGGPFPQVCQLCWLNSDAISTTVSTYYVIPVTGSGMIYQSYVLQVASMTSLLMRRHA